ncbi:hypothetical protein HDU96_007966, partial [Phlyctochytrium bullatum]
MTAPPVRRKRRFLVLLATSLIATTTAALPTSSHHLPRAFRLELASSQPVRQDDLFLVPPPAVDVGEPLWSDPLLGPSHLVMAPPPMQVVTMPDLRDPATADSTAGVISTGASVTGTTGAVVTESTVAASTETTTVSDITSAIPPTTSPDHPHPTTTLKPDPKPDPKPDTPKDDTKKPSKDTKADGGDDHDPRNGPRGMGIGAMLGISAAVLTVAMGGLLGIAWWVKRGGGWK